MNNFKGFKILLALFFLTTIFTNTHATNQTQKPQNQIELENYVKKFVNFVDNKYVK